MLVPVAAGTRTEPAELGGVGWHALGLVRGSLITRILRDDRALILLPSRCSNAEVLPEHKVRSRSHARNSAWSELRWTSNRTPEPRLKSLVCETTSLLDARDHLTLAHIRSQTHNPWKANSFSRRNNTAATASGSRKSERQHPVMQPVARLMEACCETLGSLAKLGQASIVANAIIVIAMAAERHVRAS